MKKSTIAYVLSALMAGSLVAVTPAFAERGKGHGGFGGGGHHIMHGRTSDAYIERLAARLDLSQDQLTTLRAIVDATRSEERALRDRIRESRNELRALVDAGSVNEADVRPLAEIQGQAMADLIVLRTKVKSDIQNVLTAEQREQLERMRGKRRRRG